MLQYIREQCHKVSFNHLELLAKKNLEEYDDILRGRRKRYYDIFERCIYLERRMREMEAQKTDRERALDAAFSNMMQQHLTR